MSQDTFTQAQLQYIAREIAKRPASQPEERETYRAAMNRGMSGIATVIEHIWGPRCTMREASCATCHQWGLFDYMLATLDSDSLDDTVPEDEYGKA